MSIVGIKAMSSRIVHRSLEAREPIEELSVVTLIRPAAVLDEGRTMPAGARGTVVGVLGDGAAYVVEFTEPFAALVDLAAEDLALVPGESRADLARSVAHRAP